FVTRSRTGSRIGKPLKKRVRVGLQPRHLAQSGRLGQIKLGHLGRVRSRPANLGSQPVQAAIGRDAVQPRPNRRAALETAQTLPSGEERVLQCILRVVDGTQDSVAMELKVAPKWFDKLAKSILVPASGSFDQIRSHFHPLATPLSRTLPFTRIDHHPKAK